MQNAGQNWPPSALPVSPAMIKRTRTTTTTTTTATTTTTNDNNNDTHANRPWRPHA